MRTRKVGLSNLFGMLIGGCRLVRRHLGKFMLASLLSLSAVIVMVMVFGMVLTFGIGAKPDAMSTGNFDWTTLAAVYAVAAVVGILLAPPFLAGWFTLCRKLADAEPVSVMVLFSAYRQRGLWQKLIGYSLLGLLLYVVVHALYVLAAGMFGISADELEVFLRAQSGDPTALAGLSGTFWAAYAGILVLGVVLQSMFMLGFCQAALTESPAGDALKAGIAGTLKNLISILAFLLVFMAAVLAVAIVIGILAALAIGLLSFLSKTAAYAIGVVLYVLVILLIYPLLFSFQYYVWQGILGNDGTDASRISDSDLSA